MQLSVRSYPLKRSWAATVRRSKHTTTGLWLHCLNRDNPHNLFFGLTPQNPRVIDPENPKLIAEQAIVMLRNSQPSNIANWACSTKSHLRLESIRTWIGECARAHPRCHRGFACPDLAQLPNRLLDISIPSQPWLALKSGCARKSVRYATLSHRWNDTSMPKLLRHNKKLFRRGIDVRTLPKVFQEAIEVCHFLDIRYIWIDALCLVQDDKLDYAREIVQMGTIHRHAYCNLNATSAAKEDTGLFVEGNPLHMIAFPVHIEREDFSQDFYIFSRKSLTQLDDEPLLKRGWVFQERLLSPRSIYFGDQLHQECTSLLANELFPAGTHKQRGAPEADFRSETHLKLDRLRTFEAQMAHILYERCYSLVQKYTQCELTFESDTLPAISGIARAFNERLNDKYLAGIWLQDMIGGLLWRV